MERIEKYLVNHPLFSEHKSAFLDAYATITAIRSQKSNDLCDFDVLQLAKIQKPDISKKIITIVLNIIKKIEFQIYDISDEMRNEIFLWNNV